MPLIEQVEGFKKEFNNKLDDELLLIMNNRVQSSAEHIAAAQILQKRRQDKMDEQIAIGKCTNHLTLVILILTIIILVITVGQCIMSGSRIPQNSNIRNRTTSIKEFDKADNSK